MRGARTIGATLALALAACAPAGGEDGERSVTELPAPGAALGEALMLPLAQARNHHHKADVLLREADLEGAIAALKAILDLPFPPGAPEGEDVALDARARLAKLLVTAGRLDEALALVDRGIAAATRSSFFLANLYTARGEVLEARAVSLEGSAPSAARLARREALAAFDRSIEINRRLMDRVDRDGEVHP